MADRQLSPLTPPQDADDVDLVNFASSLLDVADADSELPEATFDAATLDAVHAAINAPLDLDPVAIATLELPSTASEDQRESDLAENGREIRSRGRNQDAVRVLMWFRRDLRLHDNLALAEALQLVKQQEETVGKVVFIPLYIVHRPKIMLCGVNRFHFMLESVSDLADALAARGSRLVVARGDGVQVLRRLLPAWRITHLFFDAASEPFAIDRDKRVVALATQLGVKTHVTHGYTLYDLDQVIAGNGGKPPKTYTAFLRTLAMQPKPPKPLPTPGQVPAPAFLPSELYQQVVDYWKKRVNLDRVVLQSNVKEEKTEDEEEIDAPEEIAKHLEEIAGSEQQFTLPEVTDFGYDAPERHSFIYGGEQIALSILRDYCRIEGRVVKFEKPKTSPAQTTPSASTTSLSPFLYFGCISPRTFLHHVRGIQEHHAKVLSATPVSLDGQLLWREFFYCHGLANPYFDKMEENPTCLQIDWRWHTIPEKEEDMTDDDKLARSQFKAWTDGQTGFPWIDAIMIQLKEEGWMHHLARHSVACFLTRGDLYISWVRGLEVFQERLIDHDWSINAGNWLWLSSSYFFTAYFRVYSPSTFGKKWDPDGLFIRKYIPALSKMPVKYIYEPWKAPMTVQHAAGCLIGKEYPFPIVDHKIAMRRCMVGMKKSYAIGEYGTPPIPRPFTSPTNKRARENSSSSSETSEDSTQ